MTSSGRQIFDTGGQSAIVAARPVNLTRDTMSSLQSKSAQSPAGGTVPDGIDVIFSAVAIAERIDALAREIADSGLESPLIVPVLTGSFVFAADLLRALQKAGIAPEVDFLALASYRLGTRSSGSVDILRDLELDVAGRDVLLIDDILDTGRTLAYAKDLIAARGAQRLRTCVLLNKRVRRSVQIEADFVAFECPPVFVVGYGMDLAHRYRELPFVGRITQEQGAGH
jgi:hypoxanthine phosphoribosyltransferase